MRGYLNHEEHEEEEGSPVASNDLLGNDFVTFVCFVVDLPGQPSTGRRLPVSPRRQRVDPSG